MATPSAADFRAYLGGAASVSEELLEAALAQAKRHVQRDGFKEVHESFADLQCAYAAHLLELRGSITGGKVQSKSVGDLELTFAQNQSGDGGSYLSEYKSIRTQLLGFEGRFGSKAR